MAITDQRLLTASDGLTSGRFATLSVDVFDTLVWRRVPEPTDVFLQIGHQLAAAGKLARHVSAAAFADLRRAAERTAREKVQAVTGYREVTLADIYSAFADNIFAPGFDVKARADAELACERSLLVLDPDVVALIDAAKAAGRRVVLVSDTYFRSMELSGLLTAVGFKSKIDRLYVSCESGKPKYRDLFDVILKDLGHGADKLVHVGDSPEADVRPCQLRNIAAIHYDKWSHVPRIQAHEFPREGARRNTALGTHGDFGLTGLRSRLHQRAPITLAYDLKPYWRYGAATLAPVFAGLGRWIVGTCADTGTKTIHGIMREGRFLNRVVAQCAADLKADLATQEIWLSRRAVLRASLYADDFDLLAEFVMVTPGRTTDEMLNELGLSRADVPAGFEFNQAQSLDTLCRAIVEKPATQKKVLGISARHRANLLKGLGKLFDVSKPQTIAVADLGYAATIQTVLARILAREGAKTQLSGLYLALNERAAQATRAGTELHGYLNDHGFGGPVAALLSRTPDVLEHACMSTDGSLAAYDDAGNAVLLPNQRDDKQLAQMQALQDGIIAGVAAINGLLGDFKRTPYNSPALKDQIAQIITSAMLHPTPEDAATIGAWKHEANFDLNDFRKLTDLAFDPRELEYRGLSVLGDAGRHHVYWPAAAYLSANPFIASAFAAGANNAYDATHLTSGPLLGAVTICPNAGIGFDMRRAGAVPLNVNAFGRGHIQGAIKAFGPEAYTRLKLTWPAARSVIQIDEARVTYIGETERRTAPVKVSSWSGTKDANGAQLTDTAAADTILELGPPPAWPHALEITLRFKYLRLDPMFGGRA